ncbi:unnamed protein product, partial [Owenia fusiformis]
DKCSIIMRKKSFPILIFIALTFCCIMLLNKMLLQKDVTNVQEMFTKQLNEGKQPKYVTVVSRSFSQDTENDNASKFEVSKETVDGSTSVVHSEIQYKCQPTDLISTCQPLHYSKRLLPVTALYSFPGSGNTWMRHLIQQITGLDDSVRPHCGRRIRYIHWGSVQ